MKDQVVFKKVVKVKEKPKAANPRIGVRMDIYEQVALIANHSDTTMADVATQLMDFALDHTVISDEVEFVYEGEDHGSED